MKLVLLPTTNSGKWAMFIMAIEVALFAVWSFSPWKEGFSGIDIIAANPFSSIIAALMFAGGILAVIISFFSIVRKKEPAILVFAALLIGIYCALAAGGSMVRIFAG